MSTSSSTITMQMVAQAAGVSVGTVSKVVNSAPCNPELAQRVLRAIRTLGYRPNPYARAMRSHRTHCLGILVEQQCCSNTIWLQDLQLQLTESAAARNYQIHPQIIDSLAVPPQGFQDFPQRIDGLILVGTYSKEFLRLIDREFPVPLVSFGPRSPLSRVTVIGRDMTDGFTQMFEHLVSLGHRHMVALMTSNQSSKDKLEAIKEVYHHVADFCHLHIIQTDQQEDNSQTGYNLTAQALVNYPQGTAYIYAADALTLGGICQLAQQKLRVPQDISIVSIDNTSWARQTIPSLTSIGYDFHDLSDEIIGCLIAAIEGTPRTCSSLMHTKLFRRASTALPREKDIE